MPVWLREKIKAGAKLQEFAVDKKKTRGARKKFKKRRRPKR
jgi:hypothetical protein